MNTVSFEKPAVIGAPLDFDDGIGVARTAGKPVKVFLPCPGLERIARGFETFTRECFEVLRPLPELEVTLLKGSGVRSAGEEVVWNLHREGFANRLLDRLTHRGRYPIEQFTFFYGMIPHLRQHRPDVIFISDYDLAAELVRWRKSSGQQYRVLFSNGGPTDQPLDIFDMVQQPLPSFREKEIATGETAARNVFLPYGIAIEKDFNPVPPAEKEALRRRLDLPVGRQIIVSVGRVTKIHKRMDYVIRELAALPSPRPFLLMLGQQEKETEEVAALASELLGPENFRIQTVSKTEVPQFYRAADHFVLGSLKEGFGLVYVEALAAGLPCFANDTPDTRYIFGDEGYLGDFSQEGSLTKLLQSCGRSPCTPERAMDKHSWAHLRFSWDLLRPQYLDLIQQCAASRPLSQS